MPTVVRYVLAGVAGLLTALAFPPVGWWPVILLVWPLLFAALRGAGLRHGCYLGLVHGLACYGAGLSWMLIIFDWVAPALWLILAAFGALAGGVIGWTSLRRPRWPWLPLYAALAWSALEFVRAEIIWIAFPWMTAGLGLGPTWLAPWIGVYGAGFLLLLAAGLWVFGAGTQRLAGAFLTLMLAALGIFRPPPVTPTGPGIPVLAVQNENCDFFGCHDLTAAQTFTDGIILWPEYAAGFDLHKDARSMAMALKLAQDRNATLILGTQISSDDGTYFNEALTLEAAGPVGAHHKNHPVPLFSDGMPGLTSLPVTTRFGKIGTPICFDCDFAGPVRRMTAAGAEAFAVPSMDAARWSAKQHVQHADLFRHRALENGRWMVVCATSGLTQLIDPHGNRTAQIPILQDGVLVTELHLRHNLTFFTRAGWLCPWLICAAALTMTFGVLWQARRQPEDGVPQSHTS